MVSKLSTKQLALEIDEILSNTQIGGKRRVKKSKKSKVTDTTKSRKSKSKKRLSRSGLKKENDELDEYVSNLINLRRSSRPQSKKSSKSNKTTKSKKSKSKKLKRGLPEKLIQFRKLTEAASTVINKKGPVAMKIAKAVKDDLSKNMDSSTIDSDYAGFIKKAIQHLKDNSDHYIKIAKSLG